MPLAKLTPTKHKYSGKKKVRDFLINRFGHNEQLHLFILSVFTFDNKRISCDDISNKYWDLFKHFVDNNEF